MPEKIDQKSYRNALQNLLSCRPVAYYPSLARAVGGINAALMLSQMLYWNGTKNGQEFYKATQELLEEIGLSVQEQATARNKLVQCGAIVARRKGWPATWHYQVNLERISDLLSGLQIPPLAESADNRVCPPQNLPLVESADNRIRRQKNLPKADNRFGPGQNPTEGAIDELNTETTPENTKQEEEGTPTKTLHFLDDQIIQDLQNFGVFQSKLPLIDQAVALHGWTSEQLRQLMADCRRDDKRGTPPALLLKRIQELRPPTHAYGYPQYNDEPDEITGPSLGDEIRSALDRALKPALGNDLNSVMSNIFLDLGTNFAEDPEGDTRDLLLRCPPFIWNKYIAPNSGSILAALESLGITKLSLSA